MKFRVHVHTYTHTGIDLATDCAHTPHTHIHEAGGTQIDTGTHLGAKHKHRERERESDDQLHVHTYTYTDIDLATDCAHTPHTYMKLVAHRFAPAHTLAQSISTERERESDDQLQFLKAKMLITFSVAGPDQVNHRGGFPPGVQGAA